MPMLSSRFAPARRRPPGFLVLLVLGVLGVLAFGSACGSRAGTAAPVAGPSASSSPNTSPPSSYVGTVAGTAAFVGVVVDGSRAMAYVCDGNPADAAPDAVPTVQAWFNGPSDGRSVDVRQAAGRLQVQLDGDRMTGSLQLADGRDLTVTGQRVTGDAGLYRGVTDGDGPKAVAGWIVAASGEQRGGFGFEGGGGIKPTEFEGGGGLGVAPTLRTGQTSINLRGLVTLRISRVGITPIPIP